MVKATAQLSTHMRDRTEIENTLKLWIEHENIEMRNAIWNRLNENIRFDFPNHQIHISSNCHYLLNKFCSFLQSGKTNTWRI